MTIPATPQPATSAAYRDALLALQKQQRAQLTTLIQQTEAALHEDWLRGPGIVSQYYAPLIDQYARALNDLRALHDDPAARLSLDWLAGQDQSLRQIETNVRYTLDKYATEGVDAVTAAQRAAANAGLTDASALTQEALSPAWEKGVNPAMLFSRPNPDAIAAWVGRAGNGHPLGDLFSNFSSEATSAARQAMLFGLATGANPLQMVRGIQQAMGISRSRAITIARTEVLGSYRAAAHETYRQNSDVLGYWLWSAGGNNPCAMCMGMDGTLHGLDESLDDHPCGKCAPLPVTKPWSDILGPLGIDASDLEETSIGAPGAYETGEEKFARMSPERQQQIIGTKTGYEAYQRGEVSLKDFIGVRPPQDGFPSSYYQKSLKELQIPTRQGHLVEPSQLIAGPHRAIQRGAVTPDELMPAWAKRSAASRNVYQILRNGLPYDMMSHEQGLLITNLEQMLREELPVNVRAAVERQLQALGQSVERQTVGAAAREAIPDLTAATREVRDAQSALRDAIAAVRSDYSRNPQGLLSSALEHDNRVLAAQARLEAARTHMQSLTREERGAFHAIEPTSRPPTDLQSQRDALAAQRAAAQGKLDALSRRWESLVWQQVEFDPKDDAEEYAALEAKILKVESQQGMQIAKLKKLDQQIVGIERRIDAASAPGAPGILPPEVPYGGKIEPIKGGFDEFRPMLAGTGGKARIEALKEAYGENQLAAVLERMTMRQLQKSAREYGLAAGGTKEDVISRIVAHVTEGRYRGAAGRIERDETAAVARGRASDRAVRLNATGKMSYEQWKAAYEEALADFQRAIDSPFGEAYNSRAVQLRFEHPRFNARYRKELKELGQTDTLAVQEGRNAAEQAAQAALDDALHARIDRIPADATVAEIQEFVKAQLPNITHVELMSLDQTAARLVANATTNLMQELPKVAENIWRIDADSGYYAESLALVPRDGLSLVLNGERWADLADIAMRAPQYAADGWWVGQTPEEIIGHEIGHLLQLNYHISSDTWVEAMDRVAAAGGNPLVSTYAGDKIEESFAETFALLVYGQPADEQLPILREMAQLLKANGIDYNDLRTAVGVEPLYVASP